MSKLVKPLSEKEVREIVKEEIERTKPRWAINMENELLDKIAELATKEEMLKFKNDILTGIDEVMGELKAMREEQTLASGKLSEHSDILENHESRIKQLEKPHLASI